MVTPPNYQECQCCRVDVAVDNVNECDKQHVVCHSCCNQMNRTDCMFCIPHHTSTQTSNQPPGSLRIHIESGTPEDIRVQVNVSDNHARIRSRYTEWYRKIQSIRLGITCVADFMLVITTLVACFMSLVYLGKVYIWIYFRVHPERDDSWFGWDNFRYMIGEMFCGLVVSMLIVGCCIRDN